MEINDYYITFYDIDPFIDKKGDHKFLFVKVQAYTEVMSVNTFLEFYKGCRYCYDYSEVLHDINKVPKECILYDEISIDRSICSIIYKFGSNDREVNYIKEVNKYSFPDFYIKDEELILISRIFNSLDNLRVCIYFSPNFENILIEIHDDYGTIYENFYEDIHMLIYDIEYLRENEILYGGSNIIILEYINNLINFIYGN